MIKNKYILFCFLGFLLFSCGDELKTNKNSAETKISEKQKIQAVEVVKPQKRAFNAEILITGTAQPNQKVMLYAMESGYIQNIYKDIGDFVNKGQSIASLANPEVSRAFDEKKAILKAKKSIYERLKSIQEKTPALTSLQMVEDAEADYLTAKAAFNVFQDRFSFLQVQAPFSGIITKRMVDKGALVQSGLTQTNPQGIVEIQQINPIRLTLPLPESDVASIKKGMEVNVSFPELPSKSFAAKVSRTAGALDLASKTMQVEIDIKNPKNTIKPGMYAKAKMQITSRENVLSLPVTAQLIAQNQAFVLIVRNEKVEKIPLRKGLSNKEYFEVLNAEITEEDLVIVQGKGLVQAGQKVKAVLKK